MFTVNFTPTSQTSSPPPEAADIQHGVLSYLLILHKMATEISIDCSTALADDFYNLFNISKPIENDTQRPHPKFNTYCRKLSSSNEIGIQDKRRQEVFANLKRKREDDDNLQPLISFIQDNEFEIYNTLTKKRKPNENNKTVISSDLLTASDDPKSDNSSMQVDEPTLSKPKRIRNKRNRNWGFKNEKEVRKLLSKQLMLSEWLVDVPEDFYTNWYMVFCPRGKRTLVITANGQTMIYSRTGYFMFNFQSLLPGGGSNSLFNHSITKKSSILDCIYVEEEHTFYILDVISWNGCTFLDCDTEFRFFWLHSRFTEEISIYNDILGTNESMTKSQSNDSKTASDASVLKNINKLYKFAPMSYYDCTIPNIRNLSKGPFQFSTQIDGVLFFHKRAPYTPGLTPLVCWLKVNMIPNILHVSLD